MCVIAVKQIGVDMPKEQRLKEMWDRNKDGAGFMYHDPVDNSVKISKGYMHFDDFKNALNDVSNKFSLKDIPMIMHFRITTHGGTSPENTHPFPVTSNVRHLQALDLKTNLGVAHNGVINSVGTEAKLSDTQIYIRDVLTAFRGLSGENFLHTHAKIIDSTIGASKLAFLDNSGVITTFGTFLESSDKDGLKYSNLHFEPYVPTTTTTYGQTYYGDYTPTRYSRGLIKGEIRKANKLVETLTHANLGILKDDYLFIKDVGAHLKPKTPYSVTTGNIVYNITTGEYIENVNVSLMDEIKDPNESTYAVFKLADEAPTLVSVDVMAANVLDLKLIDKVKDSLKKGKGDDVSNKIYEVLFDIAVAYEDSCFDECGTYGGAVIEVSTSDDKIRDNIGGKSEETKNILMNANRAKLNMESLKSTKLLKIKKGTKLYHDANYIKDVAELGRVDNPRYAEFVDTDRFLTKVLMEPAVEVSSDNWYYSDDHKGILYKTKNGDFMGVFELETPSKVRVKTITEATLYTFKSAVLWYEDTGL